MDVDGLMHPAFIQDIFQLVHSSGPIPLPVRFPTRVSKNAFVEGADNEQWRDEYFTKRSLVRAIISTIPRLSDEICLSVRR
jgi:hypothetical protein